MSRRSLSGDPDFGSDSFLDIIANIVGILIILIVISGVKVARQPPPGVDVTDNDIVVVQSAIIPPNPVMSGRSRYEDTTEFSPVKLRLLQHEIKSESHHSTRLQQKITQLQKQFADLKEQDRLLQQETGDVNLTILSSRQQTVQSDTDLASLESDAAEAPRIITLLQKELASAETRQHAILSATQLVYDRQAAADSELKEITGQTQKLMELIEERQVEVHPEPDRLKHRLSPVVRTDNDQELHFRLESGCISCVPIKDLVECLTRQVSNRGGVIRRFGRYEGVCGPVGGYTMKYAVQRHRPSPLNGFNGVSTGFRIVVSRWTVTPVESLRAEPMDEAFEFGSRFRQIAEAADPDALMTVWLYPDDFIHFRKLREFGHGLGLRVAARPLPEGAKITGSPGGSRSSGQ